MTLAIRRQQLAAGLICMIAISSPQYVWTLFTPFLRTTFGVGPAALQVTFSILIVVQTLFSPIQGWIARYTQPRYLIGGGALLTGLSWVIAAQARSAPELYLAYGGLGGIGTGIVYVGVVTLLMAWFPHARGRTAGLAASGYGMGAMLTTFPIAHMLADIGWRATMGRFGFIIAMVGIVAASFLKAPRSIITNDENESGTPSGVMLRTPIFWLMFLMMAIMTTSGLMVTSQLAQIAGDFHVAHLVVFGMAALPLAMTLDRVANGVTRPLFGWISDHLGREQTMASAFALEAVAMTLWLATAHHPVAFVLLSGVVFLGWGEIFSLFPATLTDTFGTRDANRNYGFLYMAQGVGAVIGGPLAALLHQASGTWYPVFACAIGGDLITAALALGLLRPLRARFIARGRSLLAVDPCHVRGRVTRP